ncbi:MAG: hypothetical protein LBC75_08930 [Fibromonadaceae bacterium]|jgi:hypothetical protein|nr:hypothetical protein [Fibromonadaceae bacterium]
MKFLFTIALLALIGCAGSKSATEKSIAELSIDNRCEKMLQWTPELKEMSKNFVENNLDEVVSETGEIMGKTECTEIIECEKEKYCISYISPSRGKSSFFDLIHHISQKNKDTQWCEKLSKTDSDFKNMLSEIAKNGSTIMGDNNEIVGYCQCVSITKCNGVDYCSIEQCPTHKAYFLDERAIEYNNAFKIEQCHIILNAPDFVKDALKTPYSSRNVDTGEVSDCHETIICNGIEYCLYDITSSGKIKYTIATGENPRCKELMTAIPEALEANKMPTNIWAKEEKCEPIETITCNNIEYGITYKCQSIDELISIFNQRENFGRKKP